MINEQEFNAIFSENLTALMKKNRITSTQLTQLIGASHTSVYNWTHGVKVPRMSRIDKLCEILHCKRSDLMTVSQVKSSSNERLINKIRRLDQEDAEEVEAIVDVKLAKDKYKKSEAI